ncbi:hypothetical protein LOD99_723 [Oopsacas minuta]|uniref:Uncharacterized protein n=1 Tax=Oopsacas minuta TaxID=111878 RepID=A0AAV7K152_9METZ|nr:hypothetical protein LOD99_723 [Oopsacas minuta]
MAVNEDTYSLDGSDVSVSESEAISNKFQQIINREYPKFVVNVDLILKNIIKESPVYDKKFSTECIEKLRKDSDFSIEPNAKFAQLKVLQEERDQNMYEILQRTNIICENTYEQSKFGDDGKKQAPLFSNKEELLKYIVCKLSTIKTKETIPVEELAFEFD